MVITKVHMQGSAQQGLLCSLHSKICWSMFSSTTTRAKVQEPAASVNRALINISLFSLETSLSLLVLSCWGGDRNRGRRWYSSQLSCVSHGTLLCCMDKTQRGPSPPPSDSSPLTLRHSLAELGCPSAEGFPAGFPVRNWWSVFLGSPSLEQAALLHLGLCQLQCLLFSLNFGATNFWLNATLLFLPLAGWKDGGGGRGRVPETQRETFLCLAYKLLYHPIQEVAVYQWRAMFQQGAHFMPAFSAGRMWKSISCDLQKGPQKRHSFHFTSLRSVTEWTWNPTPFHCCYLTFTTTAVQLSIHKHFLWLIWYILAFERCQSAKT